MRNVYALTNILEPRGAIIEIARNGQEALDILTKAASQPGSSIDLVLMDVMMPVMDGLDGHAGNPQESALGRSCRSSR